MANQQLDCEGWRVAGAMGTSTVITSEAGDDCPGSRSAPNTVRECADLPSPDIYIQSRAHSLRSAVAGSMREALHAGKHPAATAATSRTPNDVAIATKSFGFMPNRNDSTKRVVKRAPA